MDVSPTVTTGATELVLRPSGPGPTTSGNRACRRVLHATESNAFGFHEFMRLCRLIGAEPYVAANVGSGTPQEFHDWVAYCNAPLGTLSLADERAANGQKDPFGIRYWGVGNESWGCGGNMKPGEYATLYRKFITQFPAFAPKPFLVATGPRGHSRDGDIGWTTGFFEAMHREPPDGFALHFYTDFRNTKVIPEKSTTAGMVCRSSRRVAH